MRHLATALLLLSIAAPAYAAAPLPLPMIPATPVPGAVNPAVTQETIGSTICVAGWTKTVRPHPSYTNAMKKAQLRTFGYVGPMSAFEEDHLLPIEVGGNPTSALNLYPQSWTGKWGARLKDRLETLVKLRICRGQMTLAEGQAIFLAPASWVDGYNALVVPLVSKRHRAHIGR